MLRSGGRVVKLILITLLSVLLFSVNTLMPAVASTVDFPGELEFDDVSGKNHYNYCPSYIQTDPDTRYIFYCRNPQSGVIVDSVYWRKAVRNGSEWVWSAQHEALAKGTGWESVHVCDPEVRKGEFNVGGHVYDWVMFYLGCDQLDNNHNQTGVAFADSIEGPWTKWEGNPLIGFPGTGYWGVGQPSATSIDGKGQLLLFYSKGDAAGTRIIRRHVDLSDMSAPELGEEKTLFKDGLTGKDGSYAILHNAGFAYDGSSDRFYIVRERHPYESLECNFISSELEVAYTDGSNIWNNNGLWIQEGLINPDNTGKYRNHNPGLLTDPYGNLSGGINSYEITYSVSDQGSNYLWTYRIHSIGKKDLTQISKIDDRNTAVKYSGNWDHTEDADNQFYLKTSKWSTQAGSKASLSFRGGAIEVWGSKSPSHGKFKVILNGAHTATVDAYSQTLTGPVLLYRADNLLTGFHGLSIEVAGTKNPASDGYKVDLDHFVVDVSATAFATPTEPAMQSSEQENSYASSEPNESAPVNESDGSGSAVESVGSGESSKSVESFDSEESEESLESDVSEVSSGGVDKVDRTLMIFAGGTIFLVVVTVILAGIFFVRKSRKMIK